MRTIPSSDDRDELAAVIVRIDYSDEAVWQVVRRDLEAGDRSGLIDDESAAGGSPLIVEAAAWAQATVDDVLAAVGDDEYLSVVFVADSFTLTDPDHKVLAIAVTGGLDPDDARATLEFGREFRIVPGWIGACNNNLALGNMDFSEFAGAARAATDGAFRGWNED